MAKQKDFRPRLTESQVKLILSGLWYQGCSNAGYTRVEYECVKEKLKNLIK